MLSAIRTSQFYKFQSSQAHSRSETSRKLLILIESEIGSELARAGMRRALVLGMSNLKERPMPARTLEQIIARRRPFYDLPTLPPRSRDQHETKESRLRCDICKSTDLNILGDCCRRCGASVSDPCGNFLETANG